MSNDYANFFYYLCFLILLITVVKHSNYYKSVKLLKYLGLWFGIFAILIILYSFKDKLLNNNIIANIKSSYGVSQKHIIKYFMSQDGHFYISAKVNNKNIEFLVDTGATDIMLTRKDAESLGIETNKLNYDRIYSTANGTIKCASYLIDEIKIKDFVVNDIYVVINPNDTGKSLLGMRFLQIFSKYEVNNNILTLYK